MKDRIMTVDLEYDFETKGVVSLKEVVPRLLNYFEKHNIRATFFVLGEIAEKYPNIIKGISKRGHEIASHGYDHSRLKGMSAEDVEGQLRKSKKVIEKLGVKCEGFRAPYFMYDKGFQKILYDVGYKYDSSMSSFFLGRYCNLGSKPVPQIKDGIVELAVPNWFTKFVPAGFSYYRLLYPFSKVFKVPYMMYLHPCEFLGYFPESDVNKVVKKAYSRNLDKSWLLFEKFMARNKFNWISCNDFLKKWIL